MRYPRHRVYSILCFLLLLSAAVHAPTAAAQEERAAALLDTASNLRGIDAPRRQQALNDLVALGDAAVPFLLAKAQHGATQERQLAAQALGLIGNPEAEAVLLDVAGGEDPFAAASAKRALAELYTRLPPEALAARLGQTGDENAVLGALYGMYLLATRAEGDTVVLDETVEAGIRHWAQRPGKFQVPAIETLAYGRSAESATVLIDVLQSPDPEVILAALRALQRMKPSGSGARVEPLTRHAHPEVMLEAFATLDLLNYLGVEDAYVQFLTHPDPRLRIRAVGLLAQTLPQRETAVAGVGRVGAGGGGRRGSGFDALLDVTQDPEPPVRLAAVRVLMELGDPTAGHTLARLIGDGGDEHPQVRAAAAVALARLGQPGWRTPLARDARNRDPARKAIRIDAIRAFGMIADPQDLRVLLDALDDPDPEVSSVAAVSLGALGERGAGRHLFRKLRSDQPVVSRHAREALRTIFGSDPGADPAYWPVWGERQGLAGE